MTNTLNVLKGLTQQVNNSIKKTPQSLTDEEKIQVKENLGIVDTPQVDWNASSGERGYIQNRTHYPYKVSPVLSTVEAVFSQNEDGSYYYDSNSIRKKCSTTNYDMTDDTSIEIYDYISSRRFTLKESENSDWWKKVYVNNSSNYTTPFIINYYRDTDEIEIESIWDGDFLNQGRMEIQINFTNMIAYHTLNDKYIPSHIPRSIDWNAESNEVGCVKNRTHYMKFQEPMELINTTIKASDVDEYGWVDREYQCPWTSARPNHYFSKSNSSYVKVTVDHQYTYNLHWNSRDSDWSGFDFNQIEYEGSYIYGPLNIFYDCNSCTARLSIQDENLLNGKDIHISVIAYNFVVYEELNIAYMSEDVVRTSDIDKQLDWNNSNFKNRTHYPKYRSQNLGSMTINFLQDENGNYYYNGDYIHECEGESFDRDSNTCLYVTIDNHFGSTWETTDWGTTFVREDEQSQDTPFIIEYDYSNHQLKIKSVYDYLLEDGSITLEISAGNIPDGYKPLEDYYIPNTIVRKTYAYLEDVTEAPTAEQYNALLQVLRNAGILAT